MNASWFFTYQLSGDLFPMCVRIEYDGFSVTENGLSYHSVARIEEAIFLDDTRVLQ